MIDHDGAPHDRTEKIGLGINIIIISLRWGRLNADVENRDISVMWEICIYS